MKKDRSRKSALTTVGSLVLFIFVILSVACRHICDLYSY